MHCGVRDLLSLAQTCKHAADLLARSERAWASKLRENFGLSLRVRGWTAQQGSGAKDSSAAAAAAGGVR